MSAPLVFLDTETTGVHPDRQVWEVAMIRRDPGAAQVDATTFFVEVDLDHADPFGLSVGRFYERHPMGKRLASRDLYAPGDPDEEVDLARDGVITKRDAAAKVAQWTHGAHVVGAVPNFDTEVLDRLLRDNWLIPAWHYHLVDVENLAVGYLNGRTREDPNEDLILTPPWDSEFLSRAVGVDPGQFDRHTALGDVQWAMSIYDAVMGGPV